MCNIRIYSIVYFMKLIKFLSKDIVPILVSLYRYYRIKFITFFTNILFLKKRMKKLSHYQHTARYRCHLRLMSPINHFHLTFHIQTVTTNSWGRKWDFQSFYVGKSVVAATYYNQNLRNNIFKSTLSINQLCSLEWILHQPWDSWEKINMWQGGFMSDYFIDLCIGAKPVI